MKIRNQIKPPALVTLVSVIESSSIKPQKPGTAPDDPGDSPGFSGDENILVAFPVEYLIS